MRRKQPTEEQGKCRRPVAERGLAAGGAGRQSFMLEPEGGNGARGVCSGAARHEVREREATRPGHEGHVKELGFYVFSIQ